MTSLASAEKRVARAFDTSDWYAAEQAVRALYHRQATGARKEAPAPPAVAAATLRSGAARLLAAGQITAGTSIALLLVEHWASGGPVGGGRGAAAAGGPGRVPYGSGGSDEALLALADAYGDPADLDESGRREYLRFLRAAIAFSSSPPSAGGGGAGAGHAAALLSWSDTVLASEIPLLLTRAVLSYLAAGDGGGSGPAYGDGNLADAKVVRDEFVAGVSWPTAEYGSPAAPPLANFCTLTLAAAARGRAAAPLWATLRQTYAASLGRDPSLERLLVAVGQAWFGVEPPRPPGGGGGMFGGLMGEMMRGMMTGAR
ncbi:hypothetical protein I4F81_012514 [Pyropia yezoensis]|uniref:Uncharacterized protein n=1 Tax=Pyropia yezoensis TaxID=2788 RepID=A0ACC3CJQ4_PYRYE|nr:hypothetical protein I4F81_012514 [Neopyropia yezoensis]